FPEGGMKWRVDFSKRKSDLDKRVLPDFKGIQQFSSRENLHDISLMWSRFYWNAAGLGGSLQNLVLPEEWSEEESKLTLGYVKTVEFVAALFASAQASSYWVLCEDNPGELAIYSATIFGNRVLEHSIYWSID
ncbi:MAG: hypothetical protein ACPGUX_11565, partial [Halocynthiibacter sp.]